MPLDIGVGIVLALLVHIFLHTEFSGWLVLAGIAAALLPDIDVLTALFGKWKHREFTHYPLPYIPLLVILFFIVPVPYAVLFSLGILWHFIHDTIGTGWGISWFWPFTDRRFLLFPYKRRKEMGMLATWLPREHPEWAHHGPHTWVRDLYLRANVVSILEFGLLCIAVVTLIIYVW